MENDWIQRLCTKRTISAKKLTSPVLAYPTVISISDYIRRRRLTLAAIDLHHGDQKIIDVAMKFGYNSQAAFARAFKEQIGVPPSFVTPELNLRLYPRMSIQRINEYFRIERGRKVTVAKLTRIGFGSFGNYKMVGKANSNNEWIGRRRGVLEVVL